METKNTKTWEEFIAFLKKNKAYKKYMANLNRSSEQIDEMKNLEIEDIIKYSFIWADTSEGHMFWQNLHYKWYRLTES